MLRNIRRENYLQMEMFPVEIGHKRINNLCSFIPVYIVNVQVGTYINHTEQVSLNLNLLQESFITLRTGPV